MSFEINFWVLQTVAMLLTALVIPKFWFRGWISAGIFVAALGLVNSTVWDSALFLRLPNTLTTQTATIICANGILFWLLAKLLPGVELRGIFPAIAAPLVFSAMSVFIHQYGKDINWQELGTKGMAYVQQAKDNLKGGTDLNGSGGAGGGSTGGQPLGNLEAPKAIPRPKLIEKLLP